MGRYIRAFARGAGSALNMFGGSGRVRKIKRTNQTESITTTWRKDMERLGQDFHRAMRKHEPKEAKN